MRLLSNDDSGAVVDADAAANVDCGVDVDADDAGCGAADDDETVMMMMMQNDARCCCYWQRREATILVSCSALNRRGLSSLSPLLATVTHWNTCYFGCYCYRCCSSADSRSSNSCSHCHRNDASMRRSSRANCSSTGDRISHSHRLLPRLLLLLSSSSSH